MYKTLTKYDFSREFKSWDTYKDKFSIKALDALFNYFEEYEENTGEKIELDVVAIACDWTEYESFDEIKEEYTNITDLEDLQDSTQVIELDNGGLIIQNF